MALYHSARGSVGYTIVGSPTIIDGVASGFSVSDYVNLSSTLTSFDEIVLSFIPGTYSSGRNVLFKTGINDYRGAFQQVSDTQGQYFYTKTDNTAGNRYIPCTPGIVNIFKIQYISENSISCILSRQGYEDSTFDLTDVDISATFGGSIYLGRGTSAYNAWSGSIDLNNTYIIVNGQPFFGICPIEVKKHQIMGPVGYTVVGSPTITDGVVSGFSNKINYLTTSTLAVRDLAKSEFVWKLNCNGSSMPVFSIGNNSGLWVYVMQPNTVRVKIGDDTRYDFTLPSTFNLTDTFFYKITLENYICSLYFGSTKENMTLIDTHTFTPTNPTASGNLRIGSENWNWNSGTSFPGSIDLNETYIKVNGKLWFWQPRETEKIVVNGVQVWQKPS